ncbi:MAG: class I SAM-dependent methyltransferase [Prolixibacteraceae bacterium]|nr:class I SAM-dependent methyltransferase [Prolixibacteraceae bacterium]
MKINNQNKFYTSISKYYSEIFPYNPVQLQFVKTRTGELAGKQILDIGCATGELAFQLANEDAKVTGIDLNTDLLQQAQSKKAPLNVKFQKGNMLELANDFHPAGFDTVLCFGNTLVHLQSEELIQKMLAGVSYVLKPGGHFLLQILNYDYIVGEQVSELPVIETENIKFIRKYIFDENSPLVRFQTDLVLKKENTAISNETLLLALKSKQLKELLEQAGFSNIERFSNFKKEPFGGKHLPLVVSCRK